MPNNTILLKGDLGRRYEEGRVKAATTIYPGMLIEFHTDGTLQPHASAGLSAILMVAIEDGLAGKTIDDAYAAGDLVRYIILEPGDRAQMILVDGQTSVIGKPGLTSNGDGKLKVGVSGTDALLFEAVEIVAASGSDEWVQVAAGPKSRT
jgi:hypothetical protein